MGTVRDTIRDVRSAQAGRFQYHHDAMRLAVLARDHRTLGHSLFAREAAYWARVAERAAIAESADPEPRS